MEIRKIPKWKDRDDDDSWIYDEDVNDAIKEFARAQRDNKYNYNQDKNTNNWYNIIELSSYKLVQFLKTYVNSQGVDTLISIYLRTAWRWLYNLGYKYKDVRKDVFVDGHEWFDVVEDCINFLRRMEELKPYMVEFDENSTMKPKVYPSDCAMGREKQRTIIVITHNECTFSANNGVCKAWTWKRDTFLRPKGQEQGIMTLDFTLPYGRLNLNSLTPKRREKIAQTIGLWKTKTAEIFEYGKNNDGYWDRAKLHQQVVNKALPIAKAFYPGYSLFYLFDYATSHSVYAKDAL